MKDMQDLNVSFFLNDQLIQPPISPTLTALSLIRDVLGMSGTKESCSEGVCGACTIAVGDWEGDQFIYRAKTACIMPAAQLHGKHVITIEGMADWEKLHVIQQMMLDHHAIQCGYCSPGMVMSLFCLFAKNPKPTKEEILSALEGNLCRCTGYAAIYDAADAVVAYLEQHAKEWHDHIFPAYVKDIPQKLQAIRLPEGMVRKGGYHVPETMDALFEAMDGLDAYTCLVGATDVFVNMELYDEHPESIIDLSRLAELHHIEDKGDRIFIGAATPVSQVLESPVVQEKLAGLCQALNRMGSHQSRNMASLGGNIATAAPVADGTCALLGLGAILHLQTKEGQRTIPLEDFYTGYHETKLAPQEVITTIEIPVPRGYCDFLKATKRVAVDISKLCSFTQIELDDAQNIKGFRIAFGGAQPSPAIAKDTMRAWTGKKLTEAVIPEIAAAVYAEFEPYVSKRSEPVYRKHVITNHMIKHLQDCLQQK